MKSMVVFFALAAVACGSYIPVAQPPHHPAIVLDPHGRPLDTAEVINARAVHLQAKALEGHSSLIVPAVQSVVANLAHSLGPAVVAAPSAVSHQSRVDVISSPAVVSETISTPVLAHSSLGLAGHYLHKRSLGHIAYAAPVFAPSAVSHQSRVDVISSPAVVSHAIAAPVVSHAVHAPVVAVAPSAVSHQSRVDVRTSPAIVSTSVVAPIAHAAPLYAAYSAQAAPVYGAHAGLSLSHGHLLKKRSLAHYVTPVVAVAPSAVSHQSRVDVISKPAVTVSQVVATPVVAHAAPALYAANIAPIAHSAIWSAPLALKTAHW